MIRAITQEICDIVKRQRDITPDIMKHLDSLYPKEIEGGIKLLDTKALTHIRSTQSSFPIDFFSVRGAKDLHYIVFLTQNVEYCSCPYFSNRVRRKEAILCKHILAAKLHSSMHRPTPGLSDIDVEHRLRGCLSPFLPTPTPIPGLPAARTTLVPSQMTSHQ
eukprot:gnl/Dysnectes_brevis/2784_a3393_1565.p1 GENE.gnl/Dysnectes_brevis/2784_a3393_1565~~gnl/Dysnectes_brevis/2784_a3393_1565.p1  ORF type:complete len:162 (+),score=43.48 gnl/Dysnectes_brevis/2784_a3393_1565:29-514(+)